MGRAAQDGSVDIVASDHSPSTPDVKLFDTGDFLNSWGGFAGTCRGQYLSSAAFDERHVHWSRFAQLLMSGLLWSS